MAARSDRTRVLGLTAALALSCGALYFSALPAAATTCPTVNPQTGAVSPAAAPGVDWLGCDLAGAQLANAQLNQASLQNANLTGANLTGADVAGANLGKVTWSNTTCPDGTNSNTDAGTCVGHL